MKKCKRCELSKPLSSFGKKASEKDGKNPWCFDCSRMWQLEYSRSIRGVVKASYFHQKENSKIRGHKPPSYTLDGLFNWANSNDLFIETYNSWVASGYTMELKPSFDRLSNDVGYSFKNIRICTVEENVSRHREERKFAVSTDVHREVEMLDADGRVLETFKSISIAARSTGAYSTNICYVCAGKRETAAGFNWRYKRKSC